MESVSKFRFSLKSTPKRAPKTNEPEIVATCTKNKFRLNEAATRLLDLAPGDFAAFINNEADEDRRKAGEEIIWAIIKGYPALDKSGNTVEGRGHHSGNDGLAYKGFKLACSNKIATGTGLILEGNDAGQWSALGGNEEVNKVFSIDPEVNEVEVDGEEREAYIVTFDREEEKLQRGTSTDEEDDE